MGTYARTARTGIVKLVSGGCRHFGLYVSVHQLAIAVCRTYCQKGNQYYSLISYLMSDSMSERLSILFTNYPT